MTILSCVMQSYRIPRFAIHSRGDQIPLWFSPQCEGSLITMKLGPGWYNSNFMGFAFCVVLRTPPPATVTLQFEMHFKFESGQNCIKTMGRFSIESIGRPDCLVMRSVGEDNFFEVSSALEVSFKFYLPKKIYLFEDEIQGCGIRVLYLQDIEEFCNTNKEFLNWKSNLPINESERGTKRNQQSRKRIWERAFL